MIAIKAHDVMLTCYMLLSSDRGNHRTSNQEFNDKFIHRLACL